MADDEVTGPDLDHGPNPALSAQAGVDAAQPGPSFPEYDPAGFSPYNTGEPEPEAKAPRKARSRPAHPSEAAAPEEAGAEAEEPPKVAHEETPEPSSAHHSARGRAGHRP